MEDKVLSDLKNQNKAPPSIWCGLCKTMSAFGMVVAVAVLVKLNQFLERRLAKQLRLAVSHG
jgi:predicted aconitase with swiveling domain